VGRAPLAEVFAPPEPDRLPSATGLADPEPDRSELCVVRPVMPVVAAAAAIAALPVGTIAQFRNMKYCWPSVHTFVVTQYITRPYCQ